MNPRGSYSPFLIFNNEVEKNRFNEFVKANQPQLDNIEPSLTAVHAKKEMKQQGKESAADPFFIDKIKQMYDNWRTIY